MGYLISFVVLALGMWQLAAFFIGCVLLIASTALGRGVVIALTSLVITYAVASLVMEGFEVLINGLVALTRWTDLSVFIYVFLTLFLAGTLREVGYLDLLVRGSSGMGCRGSCFMVPAVVGLLPIPGAALISAIAMRGRYIDELGMSPEGAAFINYWFSHVWILSWPLYHGIILGAAILSTSPEVILSITWPGFVVLAVAGVVVAYPTFRRVRCGLADGSWKDFIKALWPLALLAFLLFVLKLQLLYSLLIVNFLSALILKVRLSHFRNALKLATTPRIYIIVLETLLLKNLLITTGAPQTFFAAFSFTGLPEEVIVVTVPMILSFATNNEVSALPLMINYIAPEGVIKASTLFLAYLGGSAGVMISPIHPCFALTVDHFKANPAKTLALIIPATLIATALTLLLIESFY